SILMALLFNSARMVVISLFPNLLPLLFTAGLMGYFGVAIKPSTILVFSIAFGISVDDTIHFLSKYRQELKTRSWDIRTCVLNAVTETGVSMIYTSIILFFGFLVFTASNFGGTVALGTLVSVTLLVAMISNLVLLPSLLLSFHRSLVTKSFREPFLEIINEEEDIELEDLEIRKSE
ncbi:MAG TPA: MMPL family transporter, partial [Cryomorphaceae bacterium]|nr:MMPL family transporter [Cryomorphaceae bacterium]